MSDLRGRGPLMCEDPPTLDKNSSFPHLEPGVIGPQPTYPTTSSTSKPSVTLCKETVHGAGWDVTGIKDGGEGKGGGRGGGRTREGRGVRREGSRCGWGGERGENEFIVHTQMHTHMHTSIYIYRSIIYTHTYYCVVI